MLIEEYIYLQNIVADKKIEEIAEIYVELYGKNVSSDINELVNDSDVLAFSDTLPFYDVSYNNENINDDNGEEIVEKRVDAILNIIKDFDHLEIIGNPGSGKSTTLLKILYRNAKSILNGNKTLKTPFFINANEYDAHTNTFFDMLSKSMNSEWIHKHLKSGKLQILIDGLNEIDEMYKPDAFAEINVLLHEYPDNSVILTERKANFEKRFTMAVFEIIDLNENQIQRFIQNYLGKDSDNTWEQLNKKEELLKIAYNPLTLKTLLSVSENGTIPKNRGLLFQLFINSIIQREKSKQSPVNIDMDVKIDVLSYIAFEMRKEGVISLPIAIYKELILDKINGLYSSGTVNTLFSELIDNMILRRGQNNNVSFFHETYQDYFTAIYLKNIFENYGMLKIDFADTAWFESLLMCIELIPDEKKSESFFEYVFKGQRKSTDSKPITEFIQDDFNLNINVACKLAYLVKDYKPEIYKLAERYLSNYLILWKYLYFEKKTPPIPIEVLFASVASLNAEKHIHYLVNSPGWQNIWLYSEFEETHNPFFIDNADQEKEEQLKIIITAILNNTPDFGTFIYIIAATINSKKYFKSVYWRLITVKMNLLNNASENQLKQYYGHRQDFDVFLAIMSIDITFINKYSFTENSLKNNSAVLKAIIRFHIREKFAADILISELLTFKYDIKLFSYTFKRLSYENEYEQIVSFMDNLLERDINIFNNYVTTLQKIPYDYLTEKLKNVFTDVNNIIEVPYNNLKKGEFVISKIHKKRIFLQAIYRLNLLYDIRVTNLTSKTSRGHLIMVLTNDTINNQILLKNHGRISIIIDNKQLMLNYFYIQTTNNNDNTWKFTLFYNTEQSPPPIKFKEKKYKIMIQNIDAWVFNSWNYTQINDSENVVVGFEFLEDIGGNSILPKSGLLKLADINPIIEKPLLYHPDTVLSNDNILSLLQENIKEPKVIQFIRELGITFFFHKELDNVHYGIVISIYHKNVKIFSLRNSTCFEVKIPQDELLKYKLESIVVIENNMKINRIDEKDEFIDKIGYINSAIINIYLPKKEGFILNNNTDTKNDSHDFFFDFRSCNFEPEVNDTVKFIPAINWSKNHLYEPIALKIIKIKTERKKCRILNSYYHYQWNILMGQAIDLESDEPLFFRMSPESLQYIKNLNSQITNDQVFEYIVIKKKIDRFLPLIKLRRLLTQ